MKNHYEGPRVANLQDIQNAVVRSNGPPMSDKLFRVCQSEVRLRYWARFMHLQLIDWGQRASRDPTSEDSSPALTEVLEAAIHLNFMQIANQAVEYTKA